AVSAPVTGAASREPDRDRTALATAVAAVAEVVKFIPEGMDTVPADAFTSAVGRAAHSRESGRFTRARLEATASAYREALTSLG
ncbi:hypothetical protein ACW9HQ_49610, partial [Nocardia gipuzkoensis]